jgi:hypothetical protein
MSEEQAFRPQRKPIDPREIAAENQSKLDQITQIQKMATNDTPPSLQGLPIQGNIPPAVRQAFEQQQKGPKQREMEPIANIEGGDAFKKLMEHVRKTKTNYEEIELPSKGKFYDGSDGPIDGKIHVCPMTGKEEEVLATSRFVKKGQAMNMIFNNCISEEIRPERWLTEDRTYVLIYLRGISYTPSYDVEVKCPECGKRFSTTINLNDLYVDSCPDDFSAASMSDKCPVSGIPFTYRLSRGEDEQRIQDYRDKKGKENTGTDDTLLYRSAWLLENFGGVTNKSEILQLLKQLHINDVAYIRNTINNPPFGVDTDVDIFCQACLEEFTIDLPLEADFFFPRKRKKNKE